MDEDESIGDPTLGYTATGATGECLGSCSKPTGRRGGWGAGQVALGPARGISLLRPIDDERLYPRLQ